MSNVNRKIARNKVPTKEEQYEELKKDMEEATNRVDGTIKLHLDVVNKAIDNLDTEDNTLKGMLDRKKKILETMSKASGEIHTAVTKGLSEYMAKPEDEDTMDAVVKVGESIGDLNMLENEATNIMTEVYELAIGE